MLTLDAAFCQKAIVTQIRAQGGDYLVSVKGNQPTLHRAVIAAFEKAGESTFAGCDMSASVEDGHGRHEERYVTVIRDPQGLPNGWPDVGAVVVVGRERAVKGKNASTCHYYLTSLCVGAAELGGYVRGHWGVENGLHWCLDITFREDENRTRDTNAGANLGVIRRVATSLLKQDSGKGSIKAKRFNAALDHNYLRQVLQGFTELEALTLGVSGGIWNSGAEMEKWKSPRITMIHGLSIEWAVPGLNRGPRDFQSLALPTELTAPERTLFIRGSAEGVNRDVDDRHAKRHANAA